MLAHEQGDDPQTVSLLLYGVSPEVHAKKETRVIINMMFAKDTKTTDLSSLLFFFLCLSLPTGGLDAGLSIGFMLPLGVEVFFGFSEHAFAIFTTVISDILAVRYHLCFHTGEGREYSGSVFFSVEGPNAAEKTHLCACDAWSMTL